jgi:hypothetical protein
MLGSGPKSTTGTHPSSIPQYNAHSHKGRRGGRYNNYRGSRGRRNFDNNKGGFSLSSPQSSPQYPNPQLSSSRPTCQICYNMGHTVLDCYHRMNFEF